MGAETKVEDKNSLLKSDLKEISLEEDPMIGKSIDPNVSSSLQQLSVMLNVDDESLGIV